MTSPKPPTLSLQLHNFSPTPTRWEALTERAVAADTAGVDRVVVFDHVLFGPELDAYSDPSQGGIAGGLQPTGPDGHWLEPLTLLAYLSAVTTRVRLSTGILQAALRRPAVLAKMAASLDVLSNGRLELGVGVGWQRAEYDACGLDFSRRGRELNTTLEVCEALWSEDPVTENTEPYHLHGTSMAPKPAQHGGVPIWISGTSNPPVIERLARFGSGWIPWGPDIADPSPGLQLINDALEQRGRDPDDLQVTAPLPIQTGSDDDIDLAGTLEAAQPLVESGVTDLRIFAPLSPSIPEESAILRELIDLKRRESRHA